MYLGSRRSVLSSRTVHDLPYLDLISHFKELLPNHLSFLGVSPLKIESPIYSLS